MSLGFQKASIKFKREPILSVLILVECMVSRRPIAVCRDWVVATAKCSIAVLQGSRATNEKNKIAPLDFVV